MPKFNKDSVLGTFVVIISFCLVCSVLVSSAVVALGPFQKAAVINDRQKSILKVSGLEIEGSVGDTYSKYIEANLLDLDTGLFVEEKKAEADGYNFASLAKQAATAVAIPADQDYAHIRARTKYMPVYFSKNAQGEVTRIILPFYGQGLWSTMFGYIGLNKDGNTIESVGFYSHGETPGLGAEIDNPRWQALWVGKKLNNAEGQYGFAITKNADKTGPGKDFEIDSLSGATLTSVGVDNAVKYWMNNAYKPFLDKIRNGGDK